ncbi:nuclear pore complex protein NUP98A-like protein [Tanacetum coccineum]
MHLPSTIKGILQSYTNRDFVFIVLYDEAGRGTIVATGRVEQAMIKVGEEIEIMGLMQVSFFNDEEETTSRPKANTLFIPTENLSALVIHPLEAWPRNASAEKPKGVSSPTQTNGEYTEFASSSHQNGRHTDNGNAVVTLVTTASANDKRTKAQMYETKAVPSALDTLNECI